MPSKTKKMLEIEREKGQPIEAVLQDLYKRNDTQSAVAAELGITQSTLSLWLMRLNLSERRVLVSALEDAS